MRDVMASKSGRRTVGLLALLIVGGAISLDASVTAINSHGHPSNRIANVLLLITAGVIIAFIALYSVRSPWRQHQVGRRLMYLAISQAAVLVQNATSIYWGSDYPGRGLIRIVLYGSIGITWAGMVLSLLHYQEQDLDVQLNRLGQDTVARNAEHEDRQP